MTQPITNPQIIDDFLSRRIHDVLPSKDELRKRLLSGKKLRLYQGFDPSSPNLHIGHLVGLMALKGFQDLGHEVIFLIGDFTGMIGDPTGKSQARKLLTKEMVDANAITYQNQAKMILKFEGDNSVTLRRNSEWNTSMSFADVIRLSSHFTVQQMIERDMFQDRLKASQEIFLNEFLYPLVQGYDSVAMEVDMEVGGSDQLFNMMAGRKLVREILNKEKFVVMTPLLSDSSGKKIGKTEGNAINIANPPEQLFGQMMSLPDDAILSCFKLITLVPTDQLQSIEADVKTNPMAQKKHLAWEVVKMLHNEAIASDAQTHFEKTVQQGELPDNIPTIPVDILVSKFSTATIDIATLIVHMSMAKLISKSYVRRKIDEKAVKIDNKTVTDQHLQVKLRSGMIIKMGREYYKIV